MAKILALISFILWFIRSCLSIWVHLGYRLIYGNQKFRLPPITNQILLQPGTVLAKRIRQRQVISSSLHPHEELKKSHSFRSVVVKLFVVISIVFVQFNRC